MKPVDKTTTQDVTEKRHWVNILRDARAQIAHFKRVEAEAKGEVTDGFTGETALVDDRPVFQWLRKRSFNADTFASKYPAAHKDCQKTVLDTEKARELYPDEYADCIEITDTRSLTLVEE
ncbi:hypothetical protein [Nocardia sp. NPDC057440]|uniref:hypothetical protein n=1 Tax=Nocardia sp. NPDC057440 TaxID=3346134 RepID=UPI00366C5123